MGRRHWGAGVQVKTPILHRMLYFTMFWGGLGMAPGRLPDDSRMAPGWLPRGLGKNAGFAQNVVFYSVFVASKTWFGDTPPLLGDT